jgi:hypothetical protein
MANSSELITGVGVSDGQGEKSKSEGEHEKVHHWEISGRSSAPQRHDKKLIAEETYSRGYKFSREKPATPYKFSIKSQVVTFEFFCIRCLNQRVKFSRAM